MSDATAGRGFGYWLTIFANVAVVGGIVFYSDFEFNDTSGGSTATVNTEDDETYGVQTFLDYSFAGRWGMSFGLKYLVSELEVNGLGLFEGRPMRST